MKELIKKLTEAKESESFKKLEESIKKDKESLSGNEAEDVSENLKNSCGYQDSNNVSI